MNIIFEVVDKTGRKLRMTDYNWHHIVRRHPKISSQKEKIIETLEKPDKITDSLEDEETKYYQKNKSHRTLKGAVCDRLLFLGCSEINRQSYPLTKVSGLISDITNTTKIYLHHIDL